MTHDVNVARGRPMWKIGYLALRSCSHAQGSIYLIRLKQLHRGSVAGNGWSPKGSPQVPNVLPTCFVQENILRDAKCNPKKMAILPVYQAA